jgi:DNA polymerase III alpha subunit
MYIHLTTHSAYSLLEGLPLPSELVQAAQASGMTALGLTDHRTLTGAIKFVRACAGNKVIELPHNMLKLLNIKISLNNQIFLWGRFTTV